MDFRRSHSSATRVARPWRLLGGTAVALLLAGCGGAGGASSQGAAVAVVSVDAVPTPAPTPTPTATPTPAPVAAAGFLGVNVSAVRYYNGDRQFMNLLVASSWSDSTKTGWVALPVAQVDRFGDLVSLAAGQHAVRVLVPPAAAQSGDGAAIRCTWTGTATVKVAGARRTGSDLYGDHAVDFFMPTVQGSALTWLDVSAMSAADPVRNLDCREPDADRQAVFAPEFLTALKPFGILRFLDWDAVNANPTDPQWAERTPETGLDQRVVAWENMAKLARLLDADAWYNVPYDAGSDYATRLGQLIHDLTPAGRKVYVELGNEVWNAGFGATTQARNEGLAEGLDANAARATLLRYAEKTAWLMKLWTPIFADRPGQLVRVISTQNVASASADTVLGFRDTAQWVDALATAPYFGFSTLANNPGAGADTLLPLVATAARDTLATSAMANAAVARRYGKRYIAYEAGQGLTDAGGIDRLAAVNRDARMYDIYTSYIADWKARFGDTLMLFNSTNAITANGAWGLRERAGQLDAPKYRAAVAFGR